MSKASNYHHGDLADTLISTAVALIASSGPAALSLRQVARQADVSHGAPAHHFKDKAGLLTAVAIKGFQLIMEDLTKAKATTTLGSGECLLEIGEAYVRFAVNQPGYFAVMFQPELVDDNNQAYRSLCTGPRQLLKQSISEFADQNHEKTTQRQLDAMVTALWSQAHGFANLWLTGNLGSDPQLFEALLEDMLGSIMPRW